MQFGLGHDRAHARVSDRRPRINSLGAEDMPAARREIAEDVAHVIVRRNHLDLGQRLEKHRLALRRHRLEGENAGHLERLLIRVHGVE